MYCEDSPDPAMNKLHVIGRTYSLPYKYFYRRYEHEMWTPWEPVSAEIEGFHLAPVVWRDRLYLFWVTFLQDAAPLATSRSAAVATYTLKPEAAAARAATVTLGGSPVGSKKLTDLSVSDVNTAIENAVGTKILKAQLHWAEYVHGEWSTRESGALDVVLTATVPQDFDPRGAFVHVSKDYEKGEERGVKIHLGGAFNRAFRLAGRNSIPEDVSREPEPGMPYSPATRSGNRYKGGGSLSVGFTERIKTEDGKQPVPTAVTFKLLERRHLHVAVVRQPDRAGGLPRDRFTGVAVLLPRQLPAHVLRRADFGREDQRGMGGVDHPAEAAGAGLEAS